MRRNEKWNMLLLGTRDKSDFTIYLAHLLEGLDMKVLIVDATEKQIYRNGYTTLGKSENLFDLLGVDILTGATKWSEVKSLLLSNGENSTSYDVILVDIDNKESALSGGWEEANLHMYVGDSERMNMMNDAALLTAYLEQTGINKFHRVTYYVPNKMVESYFDHLIDFEIQWISNTKNIEFDNVDMELRVLMQGTLQIPFKRLSKPYKEVLAEIVSGIFGYHRKEVLSIFQRTRFSAPRKILPI